MSLSPSYNLLGELGFWKALTINAFTVPPVNFCLVIFWNWYETESHDKDEEWSEPSQPTGRRLPYRRWRKLGASLFS